MEHPCIRLIRDEHISIASILTSILAMIQRGPEDDTENFFDVLRAMLFYLDEFPARLHHPKESAYLFQPLRDKAAHLQDLLTRLETDHAREESAVRELQHLLAAWEYLGASRREAFEQQAQRYVRFYREHMQMEESILIPEAKKLLTDAQWRELDAQFEAHQDLFAANRARDPAFDRLFTKIVMRAPAPIGLGRTHSGGLSRSRQAARWRCPARRRWPPATAGSSSHRARRPA